MQINRVLHTEAHSNKNSFEMMYAMYRKNMVSNVKDYIIILTLGPFICENCVQTQQQTLGTCWEPPLANLANKSILAQRGTIWKRSWSRVDTLLVRQILYQHVCISLKSAPHFTFKTRRWEARLTYLRRILSLGGAEHGKNIHCPKY